MKKSAIPNNMTVTEQLRFREKLITMFISWGGGVGVDRLNLNALEEESGVRCYLESDKEYRMASLCGFELVDEPKFTWFILRWA